MEQKGKRNSAYKFNTKHTLNLILIILLSLSNLCQSLVELLSAILLDKSHILFVEEETTA